MNDTPKPSHWEQLAKELGAESTVPAAPPKPALQPTTQPRRADATRSAPRASTPADWSQLVSDLGATPSVVPSKRPERAAPAPAPRPAPAPVEPDVQVRHREPPPVDPAEILPPLPQSLDEMFFVPAEKRTQPEEPPRYRDEFFVEEITEIEITAEYSEESGPARGPSDDRGDDEPRRGRRRRRRRRGRGGSGERATDSGNAPRQRSEKRDSDLERETARPATPSDAWDIDDVPVGDEDEARDTETSAPTERGEEADRPRRRRRRRGGRRRGESRERTSSGADEARGQRSRSHEDRYDDSTSDGLPERVDDREDDEDDEMALVAPANSGHLDADEDGDDDHDFKVHRGIPTWDDAIGMIVGANMESRARNPSGSAEKRSRRGHGRGRSHGR